VVSLGSAGSRVLAQASVHQVASVAYRDMDAVPLGFSRGQTPFLDLPPVVALPHRIPGLAAARLSTGADIVSGAAYDAIEAEMVDMETWAVLRACQRFGLPLVGLRGISDGAAELGRLGDWADCLPVVDERLAGAVDALAAALEGGAIRL
jgi:adenosylhomocysteine nucleosidase